MKIEVKLNEDNIQTVIDYIKENPNEIRGLIQFLGDEVFDVLMSQRVMKKMAEVYRRFNSEVNYSYKKEERNR